MEYCKKKAVGVIANADFNEHSSPIFYELNILKFDDMIHLQMACLMWEYEHGNLPKCFQNYFKKVSDIHKYDTRNASAGKLTESVDINTSTHGLTMF